ncbi:MAG TPA: ABC transporter permease [Hyphomicrobiaceae bacterium]|jgi:peptide/nickel transport system permease protein|nr:ABC transporter permease [Hyphomicrobiaceae bacterium]
MKDFWAIYRRNKGSIIGLVILVVVLIVALAGPLLMPGDPWEIKARPLLPPSTTFLMGTDVLGRDVLAGVVHGAQVSLLIGLVSTLVAVTLGLLLGAFAGYFGGPVDDIVVRITEFVQTIPSFILAMVLVAVLGPSIGSIVISIAVVTWPPVCRLVRAEFMSLVQREFVEAAVVSGQRTANIIFREILPNALSPIIVMASLMVATAILTESALSFMGLGDPNRISWGYMIGAARSALRQAWWISVFPGAAIFLTVLAINLVGEGLNDALNPRLARRGRV